MTAPPPIRVLIPFAASGYLYGMERAVIETFDLLRPEVEAVFLVSQYGGENLPTVRELRRRGMRVVFFSDTKPWPRIHKPKSLRQFAALLNGVVRGNIDMLRNSRGVDAIYLPGVLYAAYALALVPGFRLERRKILLAHHELSPGHQRRLDLVNTLVTDHVHVSDFAARWMAQRSPAILATNNIVLTHRTDPPLSGPQTPQELASGPNVVCISQLSPAKGIDFLLEAFSLVREQRPDATLHLVGTGAENFPGQPNVYCWGFRADPGTFLARATVLVQPTPPSRYTESWGRSTVEAIMSGVPVVCFANGSLQDVVTDGATGIICHNETAVALAAAILRYLNDPELRAQHSANCLAEGRRRFGAEPIRESWLKFFGAR